MKRHRTESFPVYRFSPGNVWTPMWEKETKEYKDPTAAKKSGEDCQASLNVYPPSPLHTPPALDRNDKRPGTKVWPRPIEIYQIWAYPSSRTVALRKNICWQTGLSTIFFPESYSSAAKPTQLFFPCTLLQRYGKKSRFITRFRLLYKDVLICIVVLCINHSILCFFKQLQMWLILKIFETRRPWASSLTRETVPSNKQDWATVWFKYIVKKN